MTFNQVVVQVGSTEFDPLIQVVDCDIFYKTLRQAGIKKLLFQIGHGTHVPLDIKEDLPQKKVVEGDLEVEVH